MSAVAEHASEVRARGLSPLGACSAVAFLVFALVVGVLAGPVDLGVGAVLESTAARLGIPGVATSLSPTEEAILWEIRVPRVVLAALVGAMLALAGATYQGVFRNPLADPYLLGVAAGAGDDRSDLPLDRGDQRRRKGLAARDEPELADLLVRTLEALSLIHI